MKKLLFVIMSFVGMLSNVFCGGQAEDASEKVVLQYTNNAGASTLEVYKDIAEAFTEEYPHIRVEISSYGKDYESLMKANMAANTLPDLIATHGWSVARYSEYLRPLNDQVWVDRLVPSFVPIVSNADGEVFVLPLDIDQSGIVVNKGLLKDAGIDPYSIKTLEDFMNACAKVKTAGKTPIGMWGKDPRSFAHAIDKMATAFYVSSPGHDYSEELQNGTFEWSLWTEISKAFSDIVNLGYLNVDVLTAAPDDVTVEMARGNIAFIVSGNSLIKGVLEYNPDAELGFIPMPAVYDDDSNQLIGGEREAIGVWKDGVNIEESLLFLDFMARPENVSRICIDRSNAPAILGVEVDLGILTDDFEKYAGENIPIYPYFDRVMLPSGMWSTLQDIGAGLASGVYTLEEVNEIMEKDYLRLRK